MKFEELYSKAVDWAIDAHKDQRYGTDPYSHHLKDVQAVLFRFGFSPDRSDDNERSKRLTIAAWLHDIIEDTTVSYDDVQSAMGKEIADLVYAVTNEPGANRRERHEKTYPKIKAHPDAIILKLADRIANSEASVRQFFSNDLFSMYHKEWSGFRSKLKTDGVADEMWAHLDQVMSNPKYAFAEAFKTTCLLHEDAKEISDHVASLPNVTWEQLFEYRKVKKRTR